MLSHVKLMVLFKLSLKQTLRTEKNDMYSLCPIHACKNLHLLIQFFKHGVGEQVKKEKGV